MKTLLYTTWALLALTVAGCSASRLATGQAARLAVNAMPSYDRETDVEFAELAMAGQLKFLEGLLESASHDPDLLVAAARSFARYTYGFVALQVEQAEHCGGTAKRERLASRARDFYGRAYGYALRALTCYQPEFPAALQGTSAQLAQALALCTPEHAPALFWTAFAWGNLRALQSDHPMQLRDLGHAAQLMHRVVELNDTLEQAAPHLYLGAVYGRLPAFLGGNPEQSRKHYERALEYTSGCYLPARLEWAGEQLRQTADTAAYHVALGEILAAAVDSCPAYGLDNQIACAKAALRLGRTDAYPLLIRCRSARDPVAVVP